MEGSAGGPWLHGSAHRPIERHHRETEGVDERDGAVKELSLRGDEGSFITFETTLRFNLSTEGTGL